MARHQPYMYAAESRSSSRFPTSTFDPKAVTRASWEPVPQRPPQNGPLVSFNRHPDAHLALPARTNLFAPLGRRTKGAIKWSRRFQLLFRLLELNGAFGIMIMFILFESLDAVVACIMRIVPGIIGLHTLYSVYHHSREATGRTPGSSAAYQVFSAIMDLATLAVYGFGVYSVHEHGTEWTTRLADQSLLKYFVPATYYTIIGCGGLHLLSLIISLWLGWMFQKISTMPPDMNPLEDNLTARPSFRHKRQKSSIASSSTVFSEKLSTPSERARSSMVYGGDSSPPKVPFMHTRTNSASSFGTRDSQLNLPSRQYQIAATNSPRHSTASLASTRTFYAMGGQRGSYAEIPLADNRQSRPSTATPNNNSRDRLPKFTEAWAPTDSLVSRTNQRYANTARSSKSYSAINQQYNQEDSDDEYDGNARGAQRDEKHPNPLRSNPASPTSPATKQLGNIPNLQRPWTAENLAADSALTEISNNDRLVLAARELSKPRVVGQTSPRQRESSIQSDNLFSRRYGELTTGSSPVTVGNSRKISSGNDWDSAQSGVERRRVSGKIAEEGLAGQGF